MHVWAVELICLFWFPKSHDVQVEADVAQVKQVEPQNKQVIGLLIDI